MQNDFFKVIGLMSGTSLDGIDLVCALFNKHDHSIFEIISAKTYLYREEWEASLKAALHLNANELVYIDKRYGELLGDVINTFITEFEIGNIDFIASHGHTVLHQPNRGVTLQIGDGQTIADITGIKVICDFRTQDVNLGGQGAPLVPIGDELLFSSYDYCLNLGGFANISYKLNSKRIAFDICPVNIVLNYYANKLGYSCDLNGQLSEKGRLNYDVLKDLNKLPFYKKAAPKSLGLEWVIDTVFPIIDSYDIDIPSIITTFIEHVAIQIGSVTNPNTSLLITGGGVFNPTLIKRMKHHCRCDFEIPSEKLINFKEALIFAFLGVLKHENKVNCLGSVTGALHDHSSGKIYHPFVENERRDDFTVN